jgi:serine/threonine protein phosphatase 1
MDDGSPAAPAGTGPQTTMTADVPGEATVTNEATVTDEAAVTDEDLSVSLTSHHLRLDVDDWDEIYLIGDVHGCRRELEALLERLDPAPEDLLLFVGDLVRKGPDSAGVVELVRSMPNAYSVRGNNEDKLIHGRKELDGVDPEGYIADLPVAISFDGALVVHGGVDPRRDLAEHDLQDLLTYRAIPPENGYDGPFWWESYDGPARVFFGHTVLKAPVVTDHAVGLDTGCVYGGSLTAYDLHADEFVSVPAFETYQQRPDRKFLDPGDPAP